MTSLEGVKITSFPEIPAIDQEHSVRVDLTPEAARRLAEEILANEGKGEAQFAFALAEAAGKESDGAV